MVKEIDFKWDERRTHVSAASAIACITSLAVGGFILAVTEFSLKNVFVIAAAAMAWWAIGEITKRRTVWRVHCDGSVFNIYTCDGRLAATLSPRDLKIARVGHAELSLVARIDKKRLTVPNSFPGFETICEYIRNSCDQRDIV